MQASQRYFFNLIVAKHLSFKEMGMAYNWNILCFKLLAVSF